MPLKCGSESTDYHWYQVREIDKALGIMRKYGIPEIDEAYQKLWRVRGELLGKVGVLKPKLPTILRVLAGLSPGVFKVWLDPEYGWVAEARARPGAPPVYHRVSDEKAMAILKNQVTPELEKELLTPDEYLGE